MQLVYSWLGYRMKVKAGRKSSRLDDIQPERWTTDLTDELLRLLWILERTVELGAEQSALLDRIVEGDLLLAANLSIPPEETRAAPVFGGQAVLDGFQEPGDQPQLDE